MSDRPSSDPGGIPPVGWKYRKVVLYEAQCEACGCFDIFDTQTARREWVHSDGHKCPGEA